MSQSGGGAGVAAVVAAAEQALGATAHEVTSLGGGSINAALGLELDDGRSVFVKHRADASAGAFAVEADDLRWLESAGALRLPEVLAHGTEPPFLALEWIRSGPPAADHDERLGRELAALHQAHPETFGREAPNLIGPLHQDNAPADDWPTFYTTRRLAPMAREAERSGGLDTATRAGVESVCERIDTLCGPPEPPARLHGDLWAGNAITDEHGGPVLIDPSAYGGHREIDLAMMRLFGGFSERVFGAYAEVHPLADGHRERVPLYQLYPLLVHAALFGGAYGRRVVAALDRVG